MVGCGCPLLCCNSSKGTNTLLPLSVLRQMIGELSALHSFVYGGEYASPHHGNAALEAINDVASLGAVLQRSHEKDHTEMSIS